MKETTTASFDQEKPVRELEHHEWLELGMLRGWATKPVCATHDGVPNVGDEEQQWDDGGDPCQPIVRLLEV